MDAVPVAIGATSQFTIAVNPGAEFLKCERERWGQITRDAGVKPQ